MTSQGHTLVSACDLEQEVVERAGEGATKTRAVPRRSAR